MESIVAEPRIKNLKSYLEEKLQSTYEIWSTAKISNRTPKSSHVWFTNKIHYLSLFFKNTSLFKDLFGTIIYSIFSKSIIFYFDKSQDTSHDWKVKTAENTI